MSNGPIGLLGAYTDYRWTILSEIVYVTSDWMIFIEILEFFCAQSSVLYERTSFGYNFHTIVIVPSNSHCDEIHLQEKVSELGNWRGQLKLLVLSDYR